MSIIVNMVPLGGNVLGLLSGTSSIPLYHSNVALVEGGGCSRSHKHHQILSGIDTVSKKRWTKIAEPYPRPLCRCLAKSLVESARNMQNHAMTCLFSGCQKQ